MEKRKKVKCRVKGPPVRMLSALEAFVQGEVVLGELRRTLDRLYPPLPRISREEAPPLPLLSSLPPELQNIARNFRLLEFDPTPDE